ncbi:unnamed protein product [Caenorhabditis auriculariae]|uniref:PDZ domain-containing protein n=1 Tax=Caenorhabditis auriculariae TaxID=2777116 RepID=A0A8S1GYH3_9PELO|nr:unnamed protein product [Caenorhabditis auriculariae]
MSSGGRLAPVPPPKPKTFSRNVITYAQKQVDGVATPQDSDTDSGISADCDQNSPRQFNNTHSAQRGAQNLKYVNSVFPNYNNYHQTYRNPSTSDYLTPDSARRIAALSTPRRLPAQPPAATLNKSKQFRVRFADEVDSGASTSSGHSSATNSPRNDLLEINSPAFGTSYNSPRETNEALRSSTSDLSQSRTDSLQRSAQRRQPSMQQPPPSFKIGHLKEPLEPPSYSIALQRLRKVSQPSESLRDAVIRRNVTDTLQRQFRQRSSSLPRGNKTYFDGVDSVAYDYQPYNNQSALINNQLPGSLDNLHITTGTMKRRKLPTAPLMGSSCMLHMADNDELSTFRAMQHQRMMDCDRELKRQPVMLRRMDSPIRYASASANNSYDSSSFGPDGVRAQLIALDQRGFRRVMVEKMMPGPFGFYIATGMVSGTRGIFISRVSLPSLSPMLSVGDEIIYVDEELIKGRSLEYVQSVIAGKTTVTITLLPAVGQPAF